MADFDRDILNEIERDERWLAGHSTPAPTLESITRVKAIVREELRRKQMPGATRRWSSWTGAVAAAAMIALAVWVGWNAQRSAPHAPVQPPMIVQNSAPAPISPVESFREIEPDSQDQTVVVAFDDRQKELEDWSQDSNWDLTGSSLSEAMNDIYGDVSASATDKHKKPSQG